MEKISKYKSLILFSIIILILIFASLLIKGDEDTWVCNNGQWVKHGNPSSPMPFEDCKLSTSDNNKDIDLNIKKNILTENEARTIAEKSCIKGGEALNSGTYNAGTKTWWFDANLNATHEGCNPACVVSEETNIAEINWRCTGLKQPVACTMDAMQCPDGTYVGRTGPNCEFVCPESN